MISRFTCTYSGGKPVLPANASIFDGDPGRGWWIDDEAGANCAVTINAPDATITTMKGDTGTYTWIEDLSRDWGADVYVAPGGTGDGASADQPTRFDQLWTHNLAGKTIHAADGLYQGAANMIAPPAGVGGVSGSKISIVAETDGGVTIDGQGARKPLYIQAGSDYFYFEGIDFCRSSDSVFKSGGSHLEFYRCVGWDAAIGNYHVFGAYNGTDLLYRHCAGFGTCRKVWGTSQTITYAEAQDCWFRWEGGADGVVVATLGYHTYHTGLVRCIISSNRVRTGAVSMGYMIAADHWDDDESHDTYNYATDIIGYCLDSHVFDHKYMWLLKDANEFTTTGLYLYLQGSPAGSYPENTGYIWHKGTNITYDYVTSVAPSGRGMNIRYYDPADFITTIGHLSDVTSIGAVAAGNMPTWVTNPYPMAARIEAAYAKAIAQGAAYPDGAPDIDAELDIVLGR